MGRPIVLVNKKIDRWLVLLDLSFQYQRQFVIAKFMKVILDYFIINFSGTLLQKLNHN